MALKEHKRFILIAVLLDCHPVGALRNIVQPDRENIDLVTVDPESEKIIVLVQAESTPYERVKNAAFRLVYPY
jgi:hypothetical protein